jgi:hypothetical protein
MTCAETLDVLLEAEPETLAGAGDPVVAEHLQSCLRCQDIAAQLLAAHEHDRDLFLSAAPRLPSDAIARNVMAAAHVATPARHRRSHVRTIGFGLVPIAAAAMVVLAIHPRRDARREALQASIDAAFAESVAVTGVKVPPGRNAVVFKTQDPNISVIWIY